MSRYVNLLLAEAKKTSLMCLKQLALALSTVIYDRDVTHKIK